LLADEAICSTGATYCPVADESGQGGQVANEDLIVTDETDFVYYAIKAAFPEALVLFLAKLVM
jgi:hypothetical protein